MNYLDWLAEGISENVGPLVEYFAQFDYTWEITVPQLVGATVVGSVLGGAATALFF